MRLKAKLRCTLHVDECVLPFVIDQFALGRLVYCIEIIHIVTAESEV